MARHSIMGHQSTLLKQLVGSLETTREAQKNAFAALPKAEPMHEIAPYQNCQTLTDILVVKEAKQPRNIPPYTVLRCALADFAANGEKPTTEELFHEVCSKLPWLEVDTSYYVGRLYGVTFPVVGDGIFVLGPTMDDALYKPQVLCRRRFRFARRTVVVHYTTASPT